MIASVRGTVSGLVFVGLGEGVAIGIGYVIAGVPHPVLFGAVTAVASMLPFCGGIPIVIAAGLLLAQGNTLWAVLILVYGFSVTFIADHFIRPVLIGGATRLPFLLVLLGILGGIESWGLLGLFLGPALMAALVLLWREWSADPRAHAAEPH
jgi:predicted PurR-regulated permease PerM